MSKTNIDLSQWYDNHQTPEQLLNIMQETNALYAAWSMINDKD